MKIQINYNNINGTLATRWVYESALYKDSGEALNSLNSCFSHITSTMYEKYILPIAKKFENMSNEDVDCIIVVAPNGTMVKVTMI